MRRGTATVVLLAAVVAGCTTDRNERRGLATAHRPVTAAESLLAIGDSLHRQEEFAAARDSLARALAAAKAEGDERTEALVLTSLGLAVWRLGALDSATALQDSALALKQRLGLAEHMSRSLNARGLIALSRSQNREAVEFFERAIAAADQTADPSALARATGNAALAYGYLGDLRRARDGHRRMRAAGRALDDKRIEANGLANEAMIDLAEGDPLSAAARLDTALTLYGEIAYDLGEQNAVGQLATAHAVMGDFGRAFSLLDTSLSLARKRSVPEQEVETLRLLGGLHRRVGDHRRALNYYATAESIARKAGLQSDLASIHRGAAEAGLGGGNLTLARSHATTAMRMHREAGELLDELDDILLLVHLEDRAGQREVAVRHLARARELAGALDTRDALTRVTLAAAQHAEANGDPRAVLVQLRQLETASTRNDYEAMWMSAALSARAYARLDRPDSAALRGREAVDALERMRTGLLAEPLQSTFVADRSAVYGDLVIALLRLGRSEEAFAVADRARSRGLIEHLSAAGATPGAGATRDLRDADVLLRRIDALLHALRETEPRQPRTRGTMSPDEAALHSELAAARGEYEALVLRAGAADPRATVVAGAARMPLDQVRAVLAEDEALIQYLVTSDRLVLFVVRSTGMNVRQVEIAEQQLSERVRLLRDIWGQPRQDWQVGVPVAEALHRTLLGPLAEDLRGVTGLLVAPHGILAQVPFAALHDPRSGRFVAASYAVTYVPSAAALVALRKHGVGSSTLTQNRPVRQGWGFAPLDRRLPATATEVRAFSRGTDGAVALIGNKATEQALRDALTRDGIVHVASHGVLHGRHPLFSRIELARPRSGTPDNDGRLEVRELVGLPVRSALVFLSGCETGAVEAWLPEPVRGAAELALSHAFLLAGARNVVSTLWRIEDAGAGVFAGRFYGNLPGASPAAALVTAQRETLRDPRYRNPYYWGGYVLSGEGLTRITSARTVTASVR